MVKPGDSCILVICLLALKRRDAVQRITRLLEGILSRLSRNLLSVTVLLLALASVACGDHSGGGGNNNVNTSPDVCGDGVVSPGEQCDEGASNSDVDPDACRTDCRHAYCGDGVVDASELCDGANLGGSDCAGEGFTGGELRCAPDCTLDTSLCSTCGNGVREPGEACDGLDVGGANCSSETGMQHGLVTCAGDCTLNTSGCHTCGNGVIEGSETCEGTDLGGETCEGLGYAYGTLRCDPVSCVYDESFCHSICGNGVSEPGEDCDGADLLGETCASQGMVGGQLSCTGWCTFDLGGCTQCGDGVRDPEEECDTADLGGQDCASLTGGAMTGMLDCTAECRLDTSGCLAPASCGDGVVDTGAGSGEQCDGNDLGGATCQGLHPELYGGGVLVCSPSCLYDTSGCTPVEHCGNGQAEPGLGEQCDGADLDGQTCVGLGYPGGQLGCTAQCGFDTSACDAPVTCGNGVRDTGEACDGADLAGASCTSLGFAGGNLSCGSDCTYDLSTCDSCGDGLVNGDDQCDGADLGNQTCATLAPGYYGGNLSCQSDCTYDLASCEAAGWCGDGILHATEGEQCDGADFGADSCAARGFDGGVLTCTPGCQTDPSTCATCGDGTCGVGEPGSCPADCLQQPIAAGEYHTCAIKPDGTVWCWGYNYEGQLGVGTMEDHFTPVKVLGSGGIGYLLDVVAIAAAGMGTCAVKSDGTVWCWGINSAGQLGDGTTTRRRTPVQVVGDGGSGNLSNVVAISMGRVVGGDNHVCAVKLDGTVWCWGRNTFGQLGDSTTTERHEPVQVVGAGGVGTLGNVIAVSAGRNHSCALKTDGSIWCWGRNAFGQLGNNSNVDSTWPVPVATLSNAMAVGAGYTHTCALLVDGTAWCWGSNSAGQLGDNTLDDRLVPVQVTTSGGGGTLSDLVTISTADHCCAVKGDGTIWCWGKNLYGQLGDGSYDARTFASPVSDISTGLAVSVGGPGHTCAILATGNIRCWGHNNWGQLGAGTSMKAFQPVSVSGPGGQGTLSGVLEVTAGSNHSCALKTDNTVWCWGSNSSGQLGDNTNERSFFPVQTRGPGGPGFLQDVVALSATGGHTCAVLTDSTAWCWGLNSTGQLGDGSTTSAFVPVQVLDSAGAGELTAVQDISCGYYHTCAVRTDGSLWCWGKNSYGQLGDDSTVDRHLPVQVRGAGGVGFLSDVVAVSAASSHTCAVRIDGTAWCWGWNNAGQLGDNTTVDHLLPAQVVGEGGLGVFSDAISVSAGQSHSCALSDLGGQQQGFCWGRGSYGRLGYGGMADSYSPVLVSSLQSLVQISTGNDYSCALASDSSVSCWGSNSYGQLGIGPGYSNALLPELVLDPSGSGTLSSIGHVSSGTVFSCAIGTLGLVWCWGSNASGQLGNIEYYHQPTPVDVLGF